METKELSNTLKVEAIKNGLCQQWQSEWNDETTQSLIDKYLKGIDFAIEHNYPSNEFIEENFDKDILLANNIFVNDEVRGTNIGTPIVINGKSKGMLTFDEYGVATIYIRHDSEVSISCKDLSKVWVHVYDNAKVHIVATDVAKVYCYKHSNECTVNVIGDVCVRDRISE